MALLIIGLVLFVLLVVVHEFGHYIAARKNDVDVEEFGVGFPPKIYGRKFKNHLTEYTINLLPLGGFVRLKGEHDADTEKNSFGAASLGAKTKILMAGVGMNLLVALGIFTVLAWVGMPQLPLPNNEQQFSVASDATVVSSKLYATFVAEGSPAEEIGIAQRDILLEGSSLKCIDESCSPAGDPVKFSTQEDLRRFTSENAGEKVEISFKKNGTDTIASGAATLLSTEEVTASKNSADGEKGYLGVATYEFSTVRSTWSAPIVAVGLSAQFTKLTLQGLGGAIANLFAGNTAKASENVSGPIGIFFILKEGATLGSGYILLIIGLLSLTLAIMNALPIPALDGGRLAVMLGFRAFKKPLTPETEEKIHATGFVALIGLIILISIVDVRRFF